MREVILDTETTGLEPADGHKMVEIGCVELVNHVATGKTWHQYLNPERDVPAESTAVHGLTRDRLKKEPVFAQVYTDFLDFIGDARLVIHNAPFDMKFINAELAAVGHPKLPMTRVTDTLLMAREKFPGSPASLDALCRRFNIDISGRTLHGALLDSQLLADVYLELLGGRQHGLLDNQADDKKAAEAGLGPISKQASRARPFREPRPHAPSDEELKAHEELLGKLTDPLWRSAS